MKKRIGCFKSRILALVGKSAAARAFLADRAGTTAIEFAMISVPFLGLIGAVFETGSVYFKTAELQMATESAGRAVLTHSTASGLTYQQFINNYVCTHQTSGVVKPGTLSTMFDCSKIMVDIRSPLTWTNANTANDFYNTPNALGSTIVMPDLGRVAIVRIAYPMPVISGILAGGVFKDQSYGQLRTGQVQYGGAWTQMLFGVIAFRVEP
jgi:Flp pilus assembly protein TadG